MPVGRGARHVLAGQRSGGARPVLDHDRHPKRIAEAGLQRTSADVDIAAGCVGHDESDRPVAAQRVGHAGKCPRRAHARVKIERLPHLDQRRERDRERTQRQGHTQRLAVQPGGGMAVGRAYDHGRDQHDPQRPQRFPLAAESPPGAAV